MPKQIEKETEGSTAQAISKSELKKLLTNCMPYENAMGEARTKLRNLITDYVDNKHAHKAVIALVRKLDRMDAVKRAEFLFHFDICREHRGWEKADLFPDRQEPAAESGEQSDVERDLRPRHLRTGSAIPETEH